MSLAKRPSTAKPVTEKYNRGRKPLTAGQRVARGRPPAKAKEKSAGMAVATSLPDPPEFLDQLAREEWNRLGKYLVAMKRVTQLDVQSLSVYCSSFAMFGQAIRPLLIEREPLWGFVSGRARPATLAGVTFKQAEIVIELAGKFGLTARTRHLDHADTGRPLLPDELHELRGNPSKKKLDRTKTVERLGEWSEADCSAPYWFDKRAKEEWLRLIGQFENLNLWTPLDVAVLAVGCGCFSLVAKCSEKLKDASLTVANKQSDGSVEHPLATIYAKHWRICELVWKEYGLSPVDRARFPSQVAEVGGKQKLSVYLGA
jgi:P27 family predicted phage terminase small subunit